MLQYPDGTPYYPDGDIYYPEDTPAFDWDPPVLDPEPEPTPTPVPAPAPTLSIVTPNTLEFSNWMSYYGDTTPINKLLIPGTHDSGMYLDYGTYIVIATVFANGYSQT